MSNIFLIMLTAVFAENLVLTQLYGVSPLLKCSDKPVRALVTGALITVVMTASSALAYAMCCFVLIPVGLECIRTVAIVILMAALAELMAMLLRRFAPVLYGQLGAYVHLAVLNCAVFGTILVNIEKQNSLAQSVSFGFVSGIGFTVAILVFAGVRERMRFSDAPKVFRGAPILLIALALVAMAFSGFYGIKF